MGIWLGSQHWAPLADLPRCWRCTGCRSTVRFEVRFRFTVRVWARGSMLRFKVCWRYSIMAAA